MTTECAANVAHDINIYMIDLHRATSEVPNASKCNHAASNAALDPIPPFSANIPSVENILNALRTKLPVIIIAVMGNIFL